MEDLEYSINYISFTVPKYDNIAIGPSEGKTVFAEIKDKLNKEKNNIDQYAVKETDEELDKKYGTSSLPLLIKRKELDRKTKNYFRTAYNYELMTNKIYLMDFRYKLMKIYNIPICTNAWLKCYEIEFKEEIISNIEGEVIKHFGNAELPGNFILATNHLIKTHYPEKKYEWVANSYISGTRESLEDMYSLYRKYPDKWLMDKEYNGDTKSKKVIDMIKEKYSHSQDLYTSDAGISLLFEEFNKQEEVEFNLKMAEILVGLIVLKEKGNLMVKFYTFFEKQTIDLFVLTSMCFEELKITKPMTSKPSNSEVYLVGKGYKRNPKIIDILYNKVLNHDSSGMISTDYSTKEFEEYADILAKRQIEFIKRNLYYFETYVKNNNRVRDIINDLRDKYILDKVDYYLDKYTTEYEVKEIDGSNNIV